MAHVVYSQFIPLYTHIIPGTDKYSYDITRCIGTYIAHLWAEFRGWFSPKTKPAHISKMVASARFRQHQTSTVDASSGVVCTLPVVVVEKGSLENRKSSEGLCFILRDLRLAPDTTACRNRSSNVDQYEVTSKYECVDTTRHTTVCRGTLAVRSCLSFCCRCQYKQMHCIRR